MLFNLLVFEETKTFFDENIHNNSSYINLIKFESNICITNSSRFTNIYFLFEFQSKQHTWKILWTTYVLENCERQQTLNGDAVWGVTFNLTPLLVSISVYPIVTNIFDYTILIVSISYKFRKKHINQPQKNIIISISKKFRIKAGLQSKQPDLMSLRSIWTNFNSTYSNLLYSTIIFYFFSKSQSWLCLSGAGSYRSVCIFIL